MNNSPKTMNNDHLAADTMKPVSPETEVADETISPALIQLSSKAFLTDELPDNWEDLSEEDLYEFIDTHTWSPFEGRGASFIMEWIDDHAESIADFMYQQTAAIGE